MTVTRPTEPTTPDTPSDETLAWRVRSGCVRSYEELDRRLRPRLIYLLAKRVGNREDAEDLAQQALLKAYQKIDQYQNGRSFRAWLFTIATRLAIDAHRKRAVETVNVEYIERAADAAPGPAETLSQKEHKQNLWAIADRVLDPTQRTALWMHYGEQLKAKEIARALGITSVHVRVLLYRARKALMTQLENEESTANEPRQQAQPEQAMRINAVKPVPVKVRVKQGAMS